MNETGAVIRACLEVLGSSESHDQKRRLRVLADVAPHLFSRIACALLRDVKDRASDRYLLALLNSRGQLVEVLQTLATTDPGAAGTAASLAMRLIPGFDRVLAKGFDPVGVQPAHPMEVHELARGVLQTVDKSLQLLAIIDGDLRLDEVRIRSQVSLLSGRILGLWERFVSLQDDVDPRVRANAIESLWGVTSSHATDVFLRGSQDPHHRVRANALVGLYLRGDVRALTGLKEMSTAADPLARSAAAWAMGRTGDLRFEPKLQELRRSPDRNPMVIRNSLLAIARLQTTESASLRSSVRIRFLAPEKRHPGSCLPVHCEGLDGQELAPLRATDFHLRRAGTSIWRYQVNLVHPPARPLAVVLPVNPEEIERDVERWALLVKQMLTYQKGGGEWAIGYYSCLPAQRAQHATGDILHLSEAHGELRLFEAPIFRSNADEIVAAAAEASSSLDLARGPFRLGCAICQERPDADLLLVVPQLHAQAATSSARDQLRQVCMENRVRLHIACSHDTPMVLARDLQRISSDTRGWFFSAADEEEFRHLPDSMASAIRSHYEIELEDESDLLALEVRILNGRYSSEWSSLGSASTAAA